MSDSKFDLNKIKDNMGGLVGSLKSMINPAGGTPNVNHDDALGMKIAELTTLVKQLQDAGKEQVKHLSKINELLNGAFSDIEALRASVKAELKDKPKAASGEKK